MKLKKLKKRSFDRAGLHVLCLGSGNPETDRIIRRRFVEYIFQPPAHAQRIRRLTEVMSHLEFEWWKDRSTKNNSDALIYDISEEIFRQDALERFFEMIGSPSLTMHGQAEAVVSMVVSGRISELAAVGLAWFRLGFHRYVGQTLARSMQYALFLLEQVGRGNKLLLTVPIGTESDTDVGELYQFAMVTIVASATAPPHPDFPQKRWLEKLIEYLDDPVVSDVLDSVLDVVRTGHPDNLLTTFRVTNEQARAMLFQSVQEDSTEALSRFIGDMHAPKLLLSEEHEEKFRQRELPRHSLTNERKRRGEEQIAWVNGNREHLLDHFERMGTKVEEHPRRGIRPGGVDYVDVQVVALRNAGVRGVIFHPEGRPFTDPVVEILFRKETPHLFSYKIPLGTDEPIDIRLLENGTHHDIQALAILLGIVIMDAFCRIVLDERPLRPKKETEVGSTREAMERKPRPPRFRRLPTGWRASEEAKQRGEEYFGYRPPEGYTFVRADYQDGRLRYDLPSTPFAEYGDDDILELYGGEP